MLLDNSLVTDARPNNNTHTEFDTLRSIPLISVIIPAFNVERYIKKCIDSLLSQTLSDFEILVYDDGSTDKTFHLIEKYDNERIRLFRNKDNKGVVYARNFLLRQAKGKYIAFQDADDWSHKDRFSLQVALLESNPEIGACGTQYVKVSGNKNIYKSSFPCGAIIKEAIPKIFYFLPGSVMARKGILEANGFFDSYFGNDGNEDLYYLAKIILSSGFENVNVHLYYYNLNLNSLTKFGRVTKRKLYMKEITSVLLKDLILKGTNALEEKDGKRLEIIEHSLEQKYMDVTSFIIFENVISQLVFYKQYPLAIQCTIRYMCAHGEFFKSGRLLLFLIRKFLNG